MLASLGIIKGQPFAPDPHTRDLLDKAARTAYHIGHANSYQPPPILTNGYWYPDRKWVNVFPGNATFTGDTFNFIDPRVGFFTYAYSASPGMAVNMVNVGAKYPVSFVDADGEFLQGPEQLQTHPAAGHPGRALLVGDGVRLDHRIRSRQWSAVSIDQHDGQARGQCGRFD